MENELYSEAHLTDMQRMTTAIDTHSWQNPLATPRYRAAIARALIAVAKRIAPTSITGEVMDVVTAHAYRRNESRD